MSSSVVSIQKHSDTDLQSQEKADLLPRHRRLIFIVKGQKTHPPASGFSKHTYMHHQLMQSISSDERYKMPTDTHSSLCHPHTRATTEMEMKVYHGAESGREQSHAGWSSKPCQVFMLPT